VKHFVLLLLPLVLLAGCTGKKRLVTQAYMPSPPEVLMEAPKELNTIKAKETEGKPK